MTIESHPYAFEPPLALTNADVLLNTRYAPPGCANYHCQGSSGFLNTPFCDDCIWRLWAHMDEVLPEEKKHLARNQRFEQIHRLTAIENSRAQAHESDERERIRQGFMTEPGTIYYLSVGDLIKIGFTIDLDQRMRQYPPNITILATHPGTRQTERQMHHKFLSRLAKGREWFTPCEEINKHIEDVKAKFKTA